jgi:hypothetical protein
MTECTVILMYRSSLKRNKKWNNKLGLINQNFLLTCAKFNDMSHAGWTGLIELRDHFEIF